MSLKRCRGDAAVKEYFLEEMVSSEWRGCKKIQEAVERSLLLFPHEKKKAYHFSFMFERNKLVSCGVNSILSPKALYFAKRYSLQKILKYPSLHSEIACISNLWGRVDVSKFTMINVRLSRNRDIMLSKPCKDCQTVIDALGIKVIYSTPISFIEE